MLELDPYESWNSSRVSLKMDQEKYLNRINYSGRLKPDLNLLKQLQKNHLLSVPFENLDIHFNVPIRLNIDQIYKKIVLKKRGGFCYELNGLFYELLCSLGFNAKRISARVYSDENGYGFEFDHLAIIVTIDRIEYLVDVGFGAFIFEPLELKVGKIQQDESGPFSIEKDEENYLRVDMVENGIHTPEYIFQNKERQFADYEKMCQYHQSSPDSHFTKKRVISIATLDGRITISGNQLKVTNNGEVVETALKNEAEFKKALADKFQIII